MLRGVQVLAGGVGALTTTLDRVEAADDPTSLYLNIRRWMSVTALILRPGTLVPGKLTAHLQGQPPGIFYRTGREDGRHRFARGANYAGGWCGHMNWQTGLHCFCSSNECLLRLELQISQLDGQKRFVND